VAIKVKRAFPGDERLEVIAWLHDILEDTVCTYEMLLALFGDEVADAVKAMTKREDESRDDYIFLRVKPHPLARKVKLCDAFCNLHESLMRNDERRIKRYGETLGKLAIA
jgi:(p)ppGpp synthase/HD superfamily hydrolase